MVKIGLIAFANYSGLGMQTKRLAEMLNPDRVLIIDSTPFSPNKEQHFNWYKKYDSMITNGFPNNQDVKRFLPDLTHIFTVENPYNFNLVWFAQKQGTKFYCQSNYEFCENLDKPYLPVPDQFLMPSYWKLQEMKDIFGKDRVMYLPPPIDPKEFEKARNINLKRNSKKKRFLHILGTPAALDRNGTIDLLESIKFCKADFELVIKVQHNVTVDDKFKDDRVKYITDNVENPNDLYENFDALLLPRRWGGLSLTTNEGLMAGLPVIMTDISPNNELLPMTWLVKANRVGRFDARSPIDFYSVDFKEYARKIDEFANTDLTTIKPLAYELGRTAFSVEELKPRYQNLIDY